MDSLSTEEATEGMCVKLKYPDPNYSIGSQNPAEGSEWECEGRISRVDGYIINVEWSNGARNSYKGGELVEVGESVGRCNNLW